MTDIQVEQLEKAILERAQTLAKEYDERAQQARKEILAEAHEKLRLREDRETQLSKQLAERDYARHIQANELKFQRKLDTLRWDLVQSVMTQLIGHMDAMSEQYSENYQHLLGSLISEASEYISDDNLIAHVNSRDHQKLIHDWDRFVSRYTGGKAIALSDTPIDSIGGVLMTNINQDVRVDNSFEGRIERMEDVLNQTILEHLFSSVERIGSLHAR